MSKASEQSLPIHDDGEQSLSGRSQSSRPNSRQTRPARLSVVAGQGFICHFGSITA